MKNSFHVQIRGHTLCAVKIWKKNYRKQSYRKNGVTNVFKAENHWENGGIQMAHDDRFFWTVFHFSVYIYALWPKFMKYHFQTISVFTRTRYLIGKFETICIARFAPPTSNVFFSNVSPAKISLIILLHSNTCQVITIIINSFFCVHFSFVKIENCSHESQMKCAHIDRCWWIVRGGKKSFYTVFFFICHFNKLKKKSQHDSTWFALLFFFSNDKIIHFYWARTDYQR